MKSEEELKQRMKSSSDEHNAMMEGRTYDELDDAEKEHVTGLWHEVNVLHWILNGF